MAQNKKTELSDSLKKHYCQNGGRMPEKKKNPMGKKLGRKSG